MRVQSIFSFYDEENQTFTRIIRIQPLWRRINRLVCFVHDSHSLLCKQRKEHERARYRILFCSLSISHTIILVMSYYECDNGEHLATLPNIRNIPHDSSASDDCEVEVTSSIDSDEHELVRLSTYLHVHSDDEKDAEEAKRQSEAQMRLNSQVKQSTLRDFWNRCFQY